VKLPAFDRQVAERQAAQKGSSPANATIAAGAGAKGAVDFVASREAAATSLRDNSPLGDQYEGFLILGLLN